MGPRIYAKIKYQSAKLINFVREQSRNFYFIFVYSMLIASSGQASTQTPQSMHALLSITALSLIILMASLGHSSTQVPQPVHFSSSTLAGIYATLSKIPSKFTLNLQLLQDYSYITT